MLYSNERITESIIEALDRMLLRTDIPKDAVYDLTIVSAGLRHLQHFEMGADNEARRFVQELVVILQTIEGSKLPVTGKETVRALHNHAEMFLASASSGNRLKNEFIDLLKSMDGAFAQLIELAPESAGPLLATLVDPLIKQHNGVVMFSSAATPQLDEVSPGEPLNEENLSAYLRKKLGDETALAFNITTLAGGFGKETTLFSVASRNFNADLVMRRDTPINVFGNLECHIAANEFPVIKAVHSRGIAAPEPLWCELLPQIIKGPAYSIVRRVPGMVIGDATGGTGKISRDLQGMLAQTIASIHALPPLVELRGIAAHDPELREVKAGECVRQHIAAYYRFYLDSAHIATPVLHGLFNWLLAHVPESDDATTLVHGDFGFHNLLFDAGKLTAVLDWEFSHVGDPGEDLAYVRNMMGSQIEWPLFLEDYRQAGGRVPDERRLLFYEIWSHVRNTTSTVILAQQFESGRLRHVKYGMMLYRYIPYWITQTQLLIKKWNGD